MYKNFYGTADHVPRDGIKRNIMFCVQIGADDLTVTDDGDPVSNFSDFFEEVGDVNDADAVFVDISDKLQDLACILRIEHGGRLVHNDDARLSGQALEDLDKLLI